MAINSGAIAAQRLLNEFGIEHPNDFTIEELIHARDIILEEKKISRPSQTVRQEPQPNFSAGRDIATNFDSDDFESI